MSLSRSIDVRIATNFRNQAELAEVLMGIYPMKNPEGAYSSIAIDDNDDWGSVEYSSFEEVSEVLIKREEQGDVNSVTLWTPDYNESIFLHIHINPEKYAGYRNHYELAFFGDFQERILGASRYTNFSFYLNKIVPLLVDNDCLICEIKCEDSDC